MKLFDTCLSPIMIYCSEKWALNIVKNNKTLESHYLSMESVKHTAKSLLGVNSRQLIHLY